MLRCVGRGDHAGNGHGGDRGRPGRGRGWGPGGARALSRGRLRPDDPLWLIIDRLEDLRRAQEKLDAKIDRVAEKLNAKIDGQGKELRADIGNLRNYIVIPVVLVLLAAILAHFVPGL